jgi:hypothetical protein
MEKELRHVRETQWEDEINSGFDGFEDGKVVIIA